MSKKPTNDKHKDPFKESIFQEEKKSKVSAKEVLRKLKF